eukprot:CAMPEP_0206508474 /NCGR_PEP_ID=MMETSP0324_2-20121206/58364_1 /ASSEMBLY_ACC=CAM_ASM_000836 /TAXON_ID=2866 /ORGANISM="Crypthecodinium cohnii, Strain Seligo" /LENGTH=53 /DNA_ID=CAMNT_0053999365 /DNA_START=244 /DNA_END=401 /DNA_ORIENTATION=+
MHPMSFVPQTCRLLPECALSFSFAISELATINVPIRVAPLAPAMEGTGPKSAR